MDSLAATRLVLGAGLLAYAAASDLRTRRVRDPVWVVLGTAGLALLSLEILTRPLPTGAWPLLGSAALLFYAIFFGRPLFEEDGFHFRAARIALFLLAAALFAAALAILSAQLEWTQPSIELASMPVMVVLYQLFYRARLFHGGADAKALIALTLLVPTYPSLDGWPISVVDPRLEPVVRAVFPFSLSIWINAAVLFLAVPVGLVILNAVRGDFAFPQAFLGYRARLDPPPRHAWPMEKILGGDHVLVLFPRRGTDAADEFAGLRAAGVTRAWVQPQLPFMVPLFAGFLLAFLVGNVLFHFASLP